MSYTASVSDQDSHAIGAPAPPEGCGSADAEADAATGVGVAGSVHEGDGDGPVAAAAGEEEAAVLEGVAEAAEADTEALPVGETVAEALAWGEADAEALAAGAVVAVVLFASWVEGGVRESENEGVADALAEADSDPDVSPPDGAVVFRDANGTAVLVVAGGVAASDALPRALDDGLCENVAARLVAEADALRDGEAAACDAVGVPESVGGSGLSESESDTLGLRVGDGAAEAACDAVGDEPTELRLGEGLRVGDELRMLGEYDVLRVAAAAG